MRPAPVSLCAFALSCLVLSYHLPAQSPASRKPAPESKSASAKPSSPVIAHAQELPVRQLPVTQVILYKNGIGYFEHLGSVTGNQRVTIDFTSSQLNDVLQSLTVLDNNGGRIGGVNYNSTTPLAEQLKSLSLAMSDDPTSTELFQALRGQRVEVTGAPGGSITGRLMSVESRASSPNAADSDSDTSTPKPAQTRFYLTVVATSGAVRVIELTPTLSVRPLDLSLQSQLDRYLELLSSTHSTGLRHLTLDAVGSGARQLRVSYISEIPVWKSTYRIVFPKASESSAIFQGWAVVDNTIGSDWDNVQLSLVAGAPQSFIQPLSDPLYLRRPEVPIATEAQSTPQTHEAAEMAAPPSPSAPVAAAQTVQITSGAVGSPAMKGKLPARSFGVAGMEGSGSGRGVGPGSGGLYGGGVRSSSGPVAGVFDTTETNVEENVSTNAFDDFFQYSLAQPVTIHKNESAMVPILQQTLPVERVTLWSESEPKPLRALWLENNSKLTFDNGNFSVFESGAFAGEGLLDPIHPGEKRLLSYATDQAVHVRIHPEDLPANGDARQLRSVKIKPFGHLQKQYGVQSKTSYIASNSAEEARTVIIEVPRRPHRTLSPESKAAETTATLYRFRLPVPAHQSATVLVADEGPEYETWKIEAETDQVQALEYLAKQAPAIADKLQPVIAAQKSIQEMTRQLKDLEQKASTLAADEARARENLTALKGAEGAKRFADQLNRTEDAIESNRQQAANLTDKKKAAVEALQQLLSTFSLDWNTSSPTPSN